MITKRRSDLSLLGALSFGSQVVFVAMLALYVVVLAYLVPAIPTVLSQIQAGSLPAVGVITVLLAGPGIVLASLRQVTLERQFVLRQEQSAVVLEENVRAGLASNDLVTRLNALDQLHHIFQGQPEREEQVVMALVSFLSARSPGDNGRPVNYPVLLKDPSWPQSIRRDWAGWEAKRDALNPAKDVVLAYYLLEALRKAGVYHSAIVKSRSGPVENRLAYRLNFMDFKQVRASVNLSYSNLLGADFGGCSLNKSSLTHCALNDSLFDGASLDDCSFESSDLQGANFIGAHLVACVFSNANLKLASFSGCDLSNCKGLKQQQLNVVFGDRDTRVPEGQLERPQHWGRSRDEQEEEIAKSVGKVM